MTFRLLSCDGGGIRGYMSCKLIQALDQNTGGKLLQNVDGFAGTSTGGLIAIALAAGVDIGEMLDIYANDADEIFTENGWFVAEDTRQAAMAQSFQEKGLESGPGYFACQYTSAGLQKIMSQYLGAKTLGDISGKMLAVNSARLDDTSASPQHWAAVTLNNRQVGGDYSGLALLDAALATSAAPTYFPPHQIGGMGYFADGGTFANNPVMNAVEVALSSGLAGSLAEIEIVSIGTGVSSNAISTSAVGNPLSWGATSWMWPKATSAGVPEMALLNLTLDLSAQNAGGIVARLLGDRLTRIDPVLQQPVPLDGHSKADYDLMDQAVAAVQAPVPGETTPWDHAISMVSNW